MDNPGILRYADSTMEIHGTPTPEEAAAIAALIRRVLAEEKSAAAVPPAKPQLSPWVKSGLQFSAAFQDPWLPDPAQKIQVEED